MEMTSKILDHVGVMRDRLALEWVSASEAPRFVEIITEFTGRIKELGPLGEPEGLDPEELTFGLRAARAAVTGEKLRWVLGKQSEFMQEGNKYGEVFTLHEMGRLTDGLIVEEMHVNEILLLLQSCPHSGKEIAHKLSLAPPGVLQYLMALRRKELVALERIEETTPFYTLASPEESCRGS
jgi:biotin operon repressor